MKLAFLPSNLKTFICGHVAEFQEDVRSVIWDHDGDISMICGRSHDFDTDTEDGKSVRIVGIGHLLERQRELADLSLSKGEEAWREDNGAWTITPFVPDEEE